MCPTRSIEGPAMFHLTEDLFSTPLEVETVDGGRARQRAGTGFSGQILDAEHVSQHHLVNHAFDTGALR